MKKILKALLCLILVLVLCAAGYLTYVFISYHRIGDADIEVKGTAPSGAIDANGEYKLVSYNIGFGAYESDYGFFMDGGEESRAWSRERLDANLKKIADLLRSEKADLYLLQEVDTDADRTYGIDERTYFENAGSTVAFAPNYDSPYLFYPILKPHGASKSGIMTISSLAISSAKRVELPVEDGLTKILDLDRCYSKSRIPTSDGKELVLYNIHLSAYTSDGSIASEQLRLVLDDMEAEYSLGNYCVAGGDFNKDLLGDSSAYFGKGDVEVNWAQPIPAGAFDGRSVSLVAPLDETKPVPSCRNADGPYHKGQLVLTVDGFLVSGNVKVISSAVIDTGFEYSDHNPVTMTFALGKKD